MADGKSGAAKGSPVSVSGDDKVPDQNSVDAKVPESDADNSTPKDTPESIGDKITDEIEEQTAWQQAAFTEIMEAQRATAELVGAQTEAIMKLLEMTKAALLTPGPLNTTEETVTETEAIPEQEPEAVPEQVVEEQETVPAENPVKKVGRKIII